MYTPHKYSNVNLSERGVNSINRLYTFPAGSQLAGLNAQYPLQCTNIDSIIMQIAGGSAESQFQKTMNSIHAQKPAGGKCKYRRFKALSGVLQDVKLPKELLDKLKKMQKCGYSGRFCIRQSIYSMLHLLKMICLRLLLLILKEV